MKILRNLAKKTTKLVKENQFILYLLMFVIIYVIFLWLQASPTFLDPDSFYHLKMSKLIADQGVITDFPWMQVTVLKDYYIDHHFLYHVLGIPFIKIFGDFNGYKLYTVFLATGFLFFVYVFLKHWHIKFSEIYVLLLLAASNFMFRLNLTKATAFALIIIFIAIYFILKKRAWPLFFCRVFLCLVLWRFYFIANCDFDLYF